MFFGKKLKAFSMVELMMVLLISALIIAAIVPIVTRKHLQLPTVASHGAYLCYYGPKEIDDTTGEITDRTVVLREARWSGSGYTRKVFDRPTANCVFEPPKKAAFFQITAVGGGGGGSDSGYRGSTPSPRSTNPEEFSPFKVDDTVLNSKEVEYDTFKANAGKVAAFTQSKKSGKGGDMGWYKYKETFNAGTCLERYTKVRIQTNVGAPKENHPIHHSEWVKTSDGKKGTPGFWLHNGKKYIKETGAPILAYDAPCCHGKDEYGNYLDQEDPNNTCYSCTYSSAECVGGKTGIFFAQELGMTPHYKYSGSYSGWYDIPASGLDDVGFGHVCRKCTLPTECYEKCDTAPPYNCVIVTGNNPCNPIEKCEPNFTSSKVNCEDVVSQLTEECESRPESQMHAPSGGWVNDPYLHPTESAHLPNYDKELPIIYDVDKCRYKVPKWEKNMVQVDCWGGTKVTPPPVCTQIGDPDDNSCARATGEYEELCYEYDETKEDGKGVLIEGGCPTDEGAWTWDPGVAPEPEGWTLHEWDEDNWVDPPAEYTWVCPEVDGESTTDPSDPSGPCICKEKSLDEKIITYKRTDSDRVRGNNGADGARCATPYVDGDAKAKMLYYYDASNRDSGDYSTDWPNNLTNPAVYGKFFTAEHDGDDGGSIEVGSDRTVGALVEGTGWSDESSTSASYFAEYGFVPCAKKTNPYTQTQRSVCNSSEDPTWSEAQIKKGSDKFYTKAYSASKGGAPGGRNEYESLFVNGTDGTFIDKDGNETTGLITDVNGEEIEDPVRLNSPNDSKVNSYSSYYEPAVEGHCASGGDYKNEPSAVSEIFYYLDTHSYGDHPYGYVLRHKGQNGNPDWLEFAGKYRTYKIFDENEIAVGVAGEPGEAFTTLKRNIPADERTIVVGVGGSAAGMGSGAAGSSGSKTFMGSLIEVSGGAGGYGVSSPIYFDYGAMMGKVYNKVEYEAEDVCYFYEKFNKNPSLTTYMGRNRATIMGAYNAATCAAVEAAGYKYHILEGADMGDKPSYVGGIPTFNVSATSAVANTAFEYAGMGGQGGGVEHFCMASQKIIVFEDKIDYKSSVFRVDALTAGTPEYESLFVYGPFAAPTAADIAQVSNNHKIPRFCYRNDPGLQPAFNHVAAGNGKDGILLIRW